MKHTIIALLGVCREACTHSEASPHHIVEFFEYKEGDFNEKIEGITLKDSQAAHEIQLLYKQSPKKSHYVGRFCILTYSISERGMIWVEQIKLELTLINALASMKEGALR